VLFAGLILDCDLFNTWYEVSVWLLWANWRRLAVHAAPS
jgi:hypothetical protein